MFALITLISYLVLGTVVARFATPEHTQFSFSSNYLSAFTSTEISSEIPLKLNAPEISFAEIKIPVEKKIIANVLPKPIIKKAVVAAVVVENQLKDVVVAKNELPFQETVELHAVVINSELETNLISYFKEAPSDSTMMVASVEDRVSTTQAVAEEAEPEFFEYPVEAVAKKDVPAKEVKPTEEKIVTEVIQDNSDEEVSVSDIATPMAASTVNEEVSLDDDLIAFDYSKANADLKATSTEVKAPVTTQLTGATYLAPVTTSTVVTPIPTIAAATTHHSSPVSPYVPKGTTITEKELPEEPSTAKEPAQKPQEEERANEVEVTIQASGTNLKAVEKLNNFRIRFQDDSSELGDTGAGDIVVKAALSSTTKTTRSILVLKPGFIPTSTDLILSNDFYDLSVPMIEEETFNNEIHNFEGSGPVGAVLVELDDETELAQLDVPFGKVILLDGDMRITDREDFRYQLFMGVKAGNALLTYKTQKNAQVQKIIHVHEREVTFDSNFFEEVKSNNVKIFEEDLMARENSPLITGAGDIRIFATQKTATKVSNNIYKLDFDRSHLGGRRYLELNHQGETVFAGFRGTSSITMPSQNLRKYIESYKTAGSCLVQVNLKKKVLNVDIGSESVESSLMTSVQMLDSDGKFYDSVSEKTRKVIIVGEGQGANGVSRDGKINVKVEYVDGTSDYLSTFCSPDTYLVEQL
jgi:hypothetical protein